MDNPEGEFSVLMVSTQSEVISYGVRIMVSRLNQDGIRTHLLLARSLSRFDSAFRRKTHARLSARFERVFLAFAEPFSLIGFSAYSDNLQECVQLSKIIREKYPQKQIIFGGIHATAKPLECLEYADYVCVGEGFVAFPEFARMLKESLGKKSEVIAEGLPPGILSRTGAANTAAGCGPIQKDLDSLPFPSYDPGCIFIRDDEDNIIPLDGEAYWRFLGLAYFTMMSIGCPYSCAYCSNSTTKKLGRGYAVPRWHSPEYIVGEIANAMKTYDFFSVWFFDDAFIAMGEDRLEGFLKEYTSKIKLPFAVMGIIPSVAMRHPGRIERLIDAGMGRARVGVQTGSARMLEIYHRPQSNEDVIAISKIFSDRRRTGVRVIYDIILDGLGEESTDVLATLALVNRLHKPFLLNMFSLRAYPGTELAENTNIPFDPDDSCMNFRPTVGNFLIGLAEFITLPGFAIRWLERNADVLMRPLPRALPNSLEYLRVMKRIYSNVPTKVYYRMPYWCVRLIRLRRRLSRPSR